MRTEKNILMHELIGLECEVVDSGNRSQIGIQGRIVDETMKTIVLETGSVKKTVQKQGAIFRLQLGAKKVEISGDFIIARPEDRIKKRMTRW